MAERLHPKIRINRHHVQVVSPLANRLFAGIRKIRQEINLPNSGFRHTF